MVRSVQASHAADVAAAAADDEATWLLLVPSDLRESVQQTVAADVARQATAVTGRYCWFFLFLFVVICRCFCVRVLL
jgi:hypothetical protein